MRAYPLTKTRIEHVVNTLPVLLGEVQVGTGASSTVPEDDELLAVLADYYRVVEIAHFIRRGGIKAMLYRLQTGRTKFVPVDYFDDAQRRLIESCQHLSRPAPSNDQSLMQRLTEVSAEEELAVAAFLPRLDELLLASNRSQAVLADELRGSFGK